ncbi:MAG TPA: hypothetical protein VF553_18335 [Pyrinomonadaceae bacterium]
MLPISPGRAHILSVLVILIFPACLREASAQRLLTTHFSLQQTESTAGSTAMPKPQQQKKGLAPVRHEEAPEGSRVTITYNEPLSDYSAYRQGDRFVVVIPKAEAPRVRGNMRGRGFDGVQVERRGEDTVLSFRIQPGVKARVAQQYNRLEVVFSAQGQAAAASGQTQSGLSQASASKPARAEKATGGAPQTPLANHDSTTGNANQSHDAGAGTEAAGSTAATGNQQGTTADSSTATSTDGNAQAIGAATPAQSPAVQTATARPTPAEAVSPPPESSTLKTAVMRYWLPLSIAALLLISAYAIISARRRTESASAMKDETNTRAKGEARAIASRPESAQEMRSADEGPEHFDEIEPVEVETVGAAEATAYVAQEDLIEDQRPASAPFEMEPETQAPGLTRAAAAASSFAPQGDHKNGAAHSTEIVEATPVGEAVEVLAQSNPVEAFSGRAVIVKEPAVEANASRIPGTTLRYLASEDANERAAGVLDLANLGNDEAYRKLGSAFDDPVEQVRDAAARALFNINEDRVFAFKRIMREASPERRRRIGAAIASSGMAGEAISDLSSQSGERAYDALLVLSLMAKAGEVQSLIETVEEHPDTEVRLAIVKLLALSGQKDILKTFRYLATRDSLPIAVRSSIMEAIYQLNNPQPFEVSS